MSVRPIAEITFDLSYTDAKMAARLYEPVRDPKHGTWSCSFEVDEPIDVKRAISGESSLQALFLALKTLSAYLYGSDAYKNNELGIYGEFGGFLSIAAPQMMQDIAPYPF